MMGFETYLHNKIFFMVELGFSLILTTLSIWAMFAFFPRKDVRGDYASAWLILAIWLGFTAIAMNTIYWRLFAGAALRYGWLDRDELTMFGRLFGDFLWKGLSVVSIYLHFYARWKAIPKEEQKKWTPLLMGFYPDSTKWMVRTMVRMQEKLRLKNTKKG